MPNRVYKDFTLSIRTAGDGRGYHAEVTETAGGDGSAVFTRAELPLDSLSAGPADVPATDRLLSSAPGAMSYAFGLRRPPDVATAKNYGGRLFEAVFKGTLRDNLVTSRGSAQKDKAVLRLRLNLTDVPELAVLPWEYLFHKDLSLFFGYDTKPPTVIVRYLNLPEPIEDLTVKSPLRVLVMLSKPSDAEHLEVDLEWQQLAAVLTEPDSPGFSGNALSFSRYTCHFNMLSSRCLIRANRHPNGDETWNRRPNRRAKTEPSRSISTMKRPTRSSSTMARHSSSLSWPFSSPSACSSATNRPVTVGAV
jgi:hypothetical protein